MVPQEHGPLRAGRRVGQQVDDVLDGPSVFRANGHEQAGHQRKIEGHVELGFLHGAEVSHDILRPLVRFGQQDRTRVHLIDERAQPTQELVGLGQVLATRTFTHKKIRHRVHAKPVQPLAQPEIDDPQHFLLHRRVVEVQVGLVAEETVPVVLAGLGEIGPVRRFGIAEDHANILIEIRRIRPDVVVAERGFAVPCRFPEPRVLVAGVVYDQIGNDLDPEFMGSGEELLEVAHRAVVLVNVVVVAYVVAVVPQRRRVHRQQPEAVHAEIGQIRQLVAQTGKITDTVLIAVLEGSDEEFIEDGILVPIRLLHPGYLHIHYANL